MQTTLKAAGAAGLLALASISSSALADPLPFLTYQQYAGWNADVDSWSFTPGSTGWTGLDFSNPAGGDPYPANTYTNIAWNGISSGRDPSFIDIISHDTNTGGLSTPGEWHAGEWGIITTLTQTNNPLNSHTATMPNPLWTVDAVANLHIGDHEGNSIFSDLNNTTGIEFWETNNQRNSNGCRNPNPFDSTCDDIFRVTAMDFAPVQFEVDGYEYTVSFTLLPGAITDVNGPTGQTTIICPSAMPECAELDVPGDEIWVFTPEYNPGTSTVYVAMQYAVRAIPVPEPSLVGLFALGMLGLGFAARRRNENAAV